MLGAFAMSTAKGSVPLHSYLDGAAPPSEIVSGFTLVFEGDLDHAVQFHLDPSPALLVRAGLTFPNGGSTRLERYLEASGDPRRVSFGLGPLLGHGPWVHRPRQFYPGEYTLRISGRIRLRKRSSSRPYFAFRPRNGSGPTWIGFSTSTMRRPVWT